MKLRIGIGFILFSALLITRTVYAEPPTSGSASERVRQIALAANFSGQIALSDQDGEIVEHSFGFANREQRQPHLNDEPWLWASVTKQVTALLIMQQVQAGTLALDGTVHHFLPEFRGAGADQVTLRHLLQHLSGLPNPDDTTPDRNGLPSFYRRSVSGSANRSGALGYCAGRPKAEAGERFEYNNCDYLVLGAILERITGKSYAALVADRIARPLGLKSIRLATARLTVGDRRIVGYIQENQRHPAINVATFGAAGALTGTVRDLITLDRALLDGRLLQSEMRALMWKGDPSLGYEALGAWSFTAPLKGCVASVALIERRGDLGGIQVRNVIAPELGRVVAVFTNDGSVDFGEVWQGRGLAYDLLSAAFCAQTDHGAAQLNGAWSLDLRPSNDAPAYMKSMHLEITAAGVVGGDFYDHPIEDGRAFDAKGRACFAFHTSDNSGLYQTSGCRVGETIEGQTWSEGRHFLLTWTATRAKKQ